MPQINGVPVSESQEAVYNVVASFEPISDIALVPLVQHMTAAKMSSSSVRSRRAELTRKGLVSEFGFVRTGSGRKARTFVAA